MTLDDLVADMLRVREQIVRFEREYFEWAILNEPEVEYKPLPDEMADTTVLYKATVRRIPFYRMHKAWPERKTVGLMILNRTHGMKHEVLAYLDTTGLPDIIYPNPLLALAHRCMISEGMILK